MFLTKDRSNRSSARRLSPPCRGECILDTLESPQKVEHLEILVHGNGGQDRVDGRVHMVVKTENIPSAVTWRNLQQPNIESSEDIWVIVLGIRASNSSLQRPCQIVSEQRVGWLREIRPMEEDQYCQLARSSAFLVSPVDFYLPKRLHKMLDKVALAQQDISFDSSEMVNQLELCHQQMKKPLTSANVGGINRSFQVGDIAIS